MDEDGKMHTFFILTQLTAIIKYGRDSVCYHFQELFSHSLTRLQNHFILAMLKNIFRQI